MRRDHNLIDRILKEIRSDNDPGKNAKELHFTIMVGTPPNYYDEQKDLTLETVDYHLDLMLQAGLVNTRHPDHNHGGLDYRLTWTGHEYLEYRDNGQIPPAHLTHGRTAE